MGPQDFRQLFEEDNLKELITFFRSYPQIEKAWLSVFSQELITFCIQFESSNIARYLVERGAVNLEQLISFCESNRNKALSPEKLESLIQFLYQVQKWKGNKGFLQSEYYLQVITDAIKSGNLDDVHYFLTHFPETRYLRDSKKNNFILIAILHSQINIAKKLIESGWYLPHIYRNEANETAFDLAEKLQLTELCSFLYSTYDSQLLDIFNWNISKDSVFDENDDLSIKGLALMLNAKKNKIRSRHQNNKDFSVYFISGDCNAIELVQFAEKFFASDKDSCHIYHDDGGHRCLIVLERIDGVLYINVVDSLATWNLQQLILDLLNSGKYSISGEDVVLLKSQTAQQSAATGCRYYALKNLSLVCRYPSFTKEVLKDKYFIKEENVKGTCIIFYRLPPEFMHLTSSPKQLKQYIANNEDARQILRTSKQGEAQDLRAWAYHKRDKYGIQSPEALPNREFNPDVEAGENNPKEILKNNSIWYFARKYTKSVIPEMLKSHTQDELKTMIKKVDWRNTLFHPRKSGESFIAILEEKLESTHIDCQSA
ncbi:hypothetical protein Lqui_2036 [Legionella quinlivanii]|uniref:Uncharacterized protein n=1 Tax=Legionella quinlivanii TaxID=45073 RepID=A0A0W0XTR7_9GAMM|nr:ankyrin repeat domain-containing protein [Legionella quinlivanii]KTD48225.1 hypothetical protein Lqui_2036 [Legionella quinlivanii]SEF98465.1 hypothetical protein SAMN02746093_01577 [Legionella quinlivanii DSM 21216]STY11327.1 Uncharacterised protein [Legionella quinlivanii]